MRSSRPRPFDRALALAFAGRLDAAMRTLEDVAPRSSCDRDEVRWLRAYLLAATGRFAEAERLAGRVTDEATDPELAARAAVTLGSVLRQTNRYERARATESSALEQEPRRGTRAHLLIGLAADAVGLRELAEVDRSLAEAAALRARDWRATVRMRWVRCERELLAADPGRAVAAARRALQRAERAGARRHIAKSLLFLGAASAELATRSRGAAARRAAEEADRSLRRARDIARRIGARPVERIAGSMLGAPSRRR